MKTVRNPVPPQRHHHAAIGPNGAQIGFTLVELMVVVAVIAILSSVAVPSYLSSIQKSRRTDAKSALLDLAAREERYFTVYNTYTTSAASLGYAAFPYTLNKGDYVVTVATGANGLSYSLLASALGSQAGDACGGYTLNQLGLQGNVGNTLASSSCW